ncbi:MAG: hypothetical protein IT287_04290 [Bdellovibrionaceae bacterium]|nr:hypothetical protein [Pseudobdellovibrionaceae bacterium]
MKINLKSTLMVLLMPGFLVPGLIEPQYFLKQEMLFFAPLVLSGLSLVVALKIKLKFIALVLLGAAWGMAGWCLNYHYAYLFIALVGLSTVTFLVGQVTFPQIFKNYKIPLISSSLFCILVVCVSYFNNSYGESDPFLSLLKNIIHRSTQINGLLWVFVTILYYFLNRIFIDQLTLSRSIKATTNNLSIACFLVGAIVIFLDRPGLWLGLLCFHTTILILLITLTAELGQIQLPVFLETAASWQKEPILFREQALYFYIVSTIFFTPPETFTADSLRKSNNLIGVIITYIVDEAKIEKWHHEKVDPWLYDI